MSTTHTARRWLRLTLLLAAVTVLAACGPAPPGPTSAVQATAGATATATATATRPAATPAAASPAATPRRATPGTPAAPARSVASPARPATPAGLRPPVRPTPVEEARRPVIPTPPPLPAQPAAQTVHYQFYDPDGAHAAEIALVSAEADAIYDYVARRTGLGLHERITVVLQAPAASDCAARGVAYSNAARIGIFAAPGTSPLQLRAVLAHETAHILHFAAIGGATTDLTLGEGFANWAILPYWSAWQGYASFEDATRAYLADGTFVPLDDPPVNCTILHRDVIYNERASFVGYLLATYGRERFLEASASRVRSTSRSLDYVADYQAVYGKTFAQLAAEWQAWVESGGMGQ